MKNKAPQSPFAQAALALDDEFNQFVRLANELARLSLDSDRGMERAEEILGKLRDRQQRLGPISESFGEALNGARQSVADAVTAIKDREEQVLTRQAQARSLMERYTVLGSKVQQVTTAVGALPKPIPEQRSPEEAAALTQAVHEVTDSMALLVDEARSLMDDARTMHVKIIERNADSLRQSLHAARHRISQLAQQPSP